MLLTYGFILHSVYDMFHSECNKWRLTKCGFREYYLSVSTDSVTALGLGDPASLLTGTPHGIGSLCSELWMPSEQSFLFLPLWLSSNDRQWPGIMCWNTLSSPKFSEYFIIPIEVKLDLLSKVGRAGSSVLASIQGYDFPPAQQGCSSPAPHTLRAGSLTPCLHVIP